MPKQKLRQFSFGVYHQSVESFNLLAKWLEKRGWNVIDGHKLERFPYIDCTTGYIYIFTCRGNKEEPKYRFDESETAKIISDTYWEDAKAEGN